MHKIDSDSLQAQLKLQQKKIDVILAIDRIRDTISDPPAMLAAITSIMADQFQADLCLLCLLDREMGHLELKAIDDRRTDNQGEIGQLDTVITRDLIQQVVEANDVVVGRWDELSVESSGAQSPADLYLAAVPVVMREDERLGVLLLARSHSSFDSSDVEVIKIAESQIDSAVVQGYAYYDLQQRNKELETIYRVDRIRDQHLPFDEMLHRVIQELRAVIQAEMGFIMLYNQIEQKLKLQAATHDDLFRVSSHYEIVDRVANEALRQADLVCHNDLGDAVHSVLCIPLILRDEIIGVLGVVNRYGPRAFRRADCRLLRAIGSQMDTAIFESLERRRLRQVLGRSVDPRVMERLLANPDVDFLKGERLVLSVLYADLRGSTNLSERTENPELLVGFVNDYLGRMTEIILSHEGTLDKFVGDEVMALFGAPFPQPDHALRAVRVGLEMQTAHQTVIEAWRKRGIEPAPVGVGIATGELIVGEMGCPRRTDYTVIGRAANLGARICSVAQAGQVLVSQETYDLIGKDVEATTIANLQLKGVARRVDVHHVTRILE